MNWYNHYYTIEINFHEEYKRFQIFDRNDIRYFILPNIKYIDIVSFKFEPIQNSDCFYIDLILKNNFTEKFLPIYFLKTDQNIKKIIFPYIMNLIPQEFLIFIENTILKVLDTLNKIMNLRQLRKQFTIFYEFCEDTIFQLSYTVDKFGAIERVVPCRVNTKLWMQHFERYLWVSDFVKEKTVLDLGCGCGYGTVFLSKKSKSCIGIDRDFYSIKCGKSIDIFNNVDFKTMDIYNINLNQKFDVIVSFEVMEHLYDWRLFLSKVCSLLKPDGLFFVSVPNSAIIPPFSHNSFHYDDWDLNKFSKALNIYFPSVKILGQPLIDIKDKANETDFVFLGIAKF